MFSALLLVCGHRGLSGGSTGSRATGNAPPAPDSTCPWGHQYELSGEWPARWGLWEILLSSFLCQRGHHQTERQAEWDHP